MGGLWQIGSMQIGSKSLEDIDMAINTRGMFAGLGAGLSNLGQGMMSAEIQAQRDKNMSKFRAEQQTQSHANALEMQGNQQAFTAERDQFSAGVQAQAAQAKQVQGLAKEERDHGRRMEIEQYKALNNPSGVKVTNNINPDTQGPRTKKFQESMGTADAKMFEGNRAQMIGARKMEDSLKVMEEISASFETGKTQEALARMGAYIGTDASSALQAWEGAASPLTLEASQALAGVLSETDMKLVKNGIAQFGNNPSANKIMMGLMRKGIQRVRENHDSMQRHIRKEGSLNLWEPPNNQGVSDLGQQSIEAADNPGATVSGSYSRFQQFKAGRQ